MNSDTILYEQGFSINVNNSNFPLYVQFDYDARSHEITMESQHFHSYYEIFILLDERASHTVEGEFFSLSRNDIVLLKPMVEHKSKYNSSYAIRRLVINFSFPSSEAMLQKSIDEIFSVFDADLPIYRFTGKPLEAVINILNEIFIAQKDALPMRDVFIYTKLMELLYIIYRHRDQNRYVRHPFQDSIVQKIHMVTSYIQENYAQELTLKFLAAHIYISPHYLSHQFKKVTGLTLIHYIQNVRIRKAQQYLQYTDMQISQIAEICGFTSFSNFNRVFNKVCNISPSGYRLMEK